LKSSLKSRCRRLFPDKTEEFLLNSFNFLLLFCCVRVPDCRSVFKIAANECVVEHEVRGFVFEVFLDTDYKSKNSFGFSTNSVDVLVER
jgi:hypothetical protein